MAENTKDSTLAETGTDLTKFSLMGALAFIVSLGLLYVFYDVLSLPYYVAIALSFGLGAALHYFGARWFIFTDTERSVPMGLAYFIVINLIDAAIITVGTTLLVEYLWFDVYWARVAVGLLAGVTNFFLNARYNFRAL